MKLELIDYVIIAVYFLFVTGIGFLLEKKIKTGNDFLMSNRNIPLWITSLAFISANLGGQEVLGMAANIYMMPFYYGSKACSVPE